MALQVLLEMMFKRMSAHSKAVEEFKDKVRSKSICSRFAAPCKKSWRLLIDG